MIIENTIAFNNTLTSSRAKGVAIASRAKRFQYLYVRNFMRLLHSSTLAYTGVRNDVSIRVFGAITSIINKLN